MALGLYKCDYTLYSSAISASVSDIYPFGSMRLSVVFIPLHDYNTNLLFSRAEGYLGPFLHALAVTNHAAIPTLVLSPR